MKRSGIHFHVVTYTLWIEVEILGLYDKCIADFSQSKCKIEFG